MPSVLVAHCDLGSSWDVFQSTTTELSSLEEDMGILVAAVVDQGNHEIKARAIGLL